MLENCFRWVSQNFHNFNHKSTVTDESTCVQTQSTQKKSCDTSIRPKWSRIGINRLKKFVTCLEFDRAWIVRPRTNIRIKLERKKSSTETRHWFDSSSSLIQNWFGSDSSLVRLYFNGSGGCTLFDGRTISDRNRKQDPSTTLLEAQDNWFLTRTAWLCQTVSCSKYGWSPDGIAY